MTATIENRQRKVAASNGLTFRLRTEGTRSGERLLLGQEVEVHLASKAIFNGSKQAPCQGNGCPHCERDKAVTRIANIPVVVMDEFCRIEAMPRKLHDIIAEKVYLASSAGMDPTTISFTLKKERWRWDVRMDTPIVVSPGKRLGKSDLNVTSTELEVLIHLERWAGRLLAQGQQPTNEGWIGELTRAFGWDEKQAADVVDRCVVDGRLKVR